MTERLEHILRLTFFSSNITLSILPYILKSTQKEPETPGNEPFRKGKKCLLFRILKFQPQISIDQNLANFDETLSTSLMLPTGFKKCIYF